MSDWQRINALKQIMRKLLPESSYEEYFEATTTTKVLELLCAAVNEMYGDSTLFSIAKPIAVIVKHVNLILDSDIQLYIGDVVNPNASTKTIMETMLFAVDRMWAIRESVPETYVDEVIAQRNQLEAEAQTQQSESNRISIEYQKYRESMHELHSKVKQKKQMCKELSANSSEQECEEVEANIQLVEEKTAQLRKKIENYKDGNAAEERLKLIPTMREKVNAMKKEYLPVESNVDGDDMFEETLEKWELFQSTFDMLVKEVSDRDEILNRGVQYQKVEDCLIQRVQEREIAIGDMNEERKIIENDCSAYLEKDKEIQSDLILLDDAISEQLKSLNILHEDCTELGKMSGTEFASANEIIEYLSTKIAEAESDMRRFLRLG